MDKVIVERLLKLNSQMDAYGEQEKSEKITSWINPPTPDEIASRKVKESIQRLAVVYNKHESLTPEEMQELSVLEACIHVFEVRKMLNDLPFGDFDDSEKNLQMMKFEFWIQLLMNQELKKACSDSNQRYDMINKAINERMNQLPDHLYIRHALGHTGDTKGFIGRIDGLLSKIKETYGLRALTSLIPEVIAFSKFLSASTLQKTIPEYVAENQRLVSIYEKLKSAINSSTTKQNPELPNQQQY